MPVTPGSAPLVPPPPAQSNTGSVLVGENVVYPGVIIGQDVLIDPGVTFGIDNLIVDGVYICSGCHLGAYVSLREECFLGMGVVVVPERTIGRRAVIGAGAVVGLGATPYYRRGPSLPQTPVEMACKAIFAACDDAG